MKLEALRASFSNGHQAQLPPLPKKPKTPKQRKGWVDARIKFQTKQGAPLRISDVSSSRLTTFIREHLLAHGWPETTNVTFVGSKIYAQPGLDNNPAPSEFKLTYVVARDKMSAQIGFPEWGA
jgi:hypothetical protein